LAGSIKRKNYVDEKSNLNNAYSKSTLHSEAPTENNNKNEAVFQRDYLREEDGVSFKCLQESLAKQRKTAPKVPLSKIGYLEESSNRQLDPTRLEETPLRVKEFDVREEEFTVYLELLFDQLDSKRVGKLDKFNCEYVSIREEFKIAFGYILIRIKVKDLILNKEEFVRLGLQTIKELNSEEFNQLLRDVKHVREYTFA
jgi:hypothetical protein